MRMETDIIMMAVEKGMLFMNSNTIELVYNEFERLR